MTQTDLNQIVNQIVAALGTPLYADPGFWIGLVGIGVSAVGLWFSLRAFWEARKAKIAAREAGQFIKVQTVVIELTEIVQGLDKLDVDLDFATARDSLTAVTRRLRRLMAPFQNIERYAAPCAILRSLLAEAKTGLTDVTPTAEKASPHAIYYAMQGHFAEISAQVAEMIGLFEATTIEMPNERPTD